MRNIGLEKRTEKFAASAKGMNIDLTDEMLQQFKTYYELLVDWNTRMNLTAITEYEDVVLKHFLDSLSLVRAGEKFANLHQELRLIDVGCGAGFHAGLQRDGQRNLENRADALRRCSRCAKTGH